MDIFFERHPVGTLDIGADTAVFRYEPGWLALPGAFPVSTTMPMSDKPYPWDVVAPWLSNLLPEDIDTLRVMARILDVPHTEVLALLGKAGRDTSGGLSFAERGTTGNSAIWVGTGADLERIIDDLPAKPFLAGEKRVSMLVAGVQEKLPVRLAEDGRIGIPVDGAPSSHILKPDSRRLHGSVQNEALCLNLARRVGLDASAATTGRAGAREYLLVERFDRAGRSGLVRRLHQEDFCQALGLPPGAKYQHSRDYSGPKGSFRQMMDRLREVGGGSGVMRLWDMLVFNVLVCNTDAHMKNHSIVLAGGGISLAPLYDVMCTEIWDVARYLALDVGGNRDGRHIVGHRWVREAETCAIAPRQALARVEELARRTMEEFDAAAEEVAAMPAGPHEVIAQMRDAVTRRCRTVLGTLDE